MIISTPFSPSIGPISSSPSGLLSDLLFVELFDKLLRGLVPPSCQQGVSDIQRLGLSEPDDRAAAPAPGRRWPGENIRGASLLPLPVQPLRHDGDGAPLVGGFHEDREGGFVALAVEDRRF